jgi:hypothetical protein
VAATLQAVEMGLVLAGGYTRAPSANPPGTTRAPTRRPKVRGTLATGKEAHRAHQTVRGTLARGEVERLR